MKQPASIEIYIFLWKMKWNIYTLKIISYFIEIQFFNAAKTWTDAEKHCKGLGAELATVTTAEENSYLKQIIIDKYVEFCDFTDD